MRLLSLSVIAMMIGTGGVLYAESTPLGATLVEGREDNRIAVDYAGQKEVAPSGLTYNAKAGTYHYKVYLPEGYYENAPRQYPCLFIASPNGDASRRPMHEWLTAHQWVVVMLVESKNDDPESQVANFVAAHDDAVKRLRIDEGLKFAAGISGGASASSRNVALRDGFAGAILHAGGFFYQQGFEYGAFLKSHPGLYVHVMIGRGDTEKLPTMNRIVSMDPDHDNLVAQWFEGGHTWAPEEMASKALDAAEQHAFRHYFARGVKTLSESQENKDIDRLLRMEQLVWIGSKIADADESTKEQLAQLDAQVRELRKDRDIRTALASLISFWKIGAVESKLRRDAKDKPDPRALAQVAKQYRAYGSRYKDTPEGQLAAERFEAIRQEVSR